MKLRHIIAAAFTVGTALAAPAQAGVLAAADLNISKLFLVNANQTPVTTGISVKSDVRTGNATSEYNGVQGTGGGNSNDSSIAIGGTVNVQKRCAGPDCVTAPIGEDDTVTHLNAPAGSFALSDMILEGLLTNPLGARGLTRADVSIANADALGGANSTILNGATALTTFTTGSTMTLGFGLTYDAFAKVFMSADPGMSGNASAKYSWSLALVDNTLHTQVLSYTPAELNKGFTLAEPGSDGFSSAGTLFSNTFTAIGGHTYALTINQASNSLASLSKDVPEPGSVMLVGLGLAALGASVRRRRAR